MYAQAKNNQIWAEKERQFQHYSLTRMVYESYFKKDPEPHSPWDWSKSRIFISWATKVQWKSDHNRKRSSLELQKGNKKVEWETIYENSNIPNLHCSPKLQKTLVSTRVERERDRQRKSRHENPTRTKKRIDIVSKQEKGSRTTA